MRGLSLRQIPQGKPGAGIKVVRLHYLADPTMTPERIAFLKAKYPDPSIWNREMEIDPQARGGKKVFPGFDESVNLVDFFRLQPESWTVYLMADPHPRRAHAFVWLAVNRYSDMVVPWSWWPEEVNIERELAGQSRLLIRDYRDGLLDVEKSGLFPPSHIEIMDSAGKNFDADEEHNYFDAYQEHGVNFQPAKKNREYAGYDLISAALRPEKAVFNDVEVMKPRLTIMRGCGDNHKLIAQLKNLRFREWKGTVTDKDAPSDPMDKNRHLVDCLSYGLLFEPYFIDAGGQVTPFRPLYPKVGY